MRWALALSICVASVQVAAEVSADGSIAESPQLRSGEQEPSMGDEGIMMAALQDQDREIKSLKSTLAANQVEIKKLQEEEHTKSSQLELQQQRQQIQKLQAEVKSRDGEIKTLFDDLQVATEKDGPHLAAVLLTGAQLKDKASWWNFRDRVVQARKNWAKKLSMTAVAGNSIFFREILAKSGCTNGTDVTSSRTQTSYHEWTCKGKDFEPFKVVVTPCAEDEKAAAADCKWDAAVDYMMYARPGKYAGIDWFEIGTDDMGLAAPLLSDMLRHYNSSERIVLNSAARTLDAQRNGAGDRVSHDVDYCNHAIPQRFSGAIVSRGLMKAAQADFADGGLQMVAKKFRGAHFDTGAGLVFWRHAAMFLPVEGNTGGQSLEKNPRVHDVMLAPNLRDQAAFQSLTEQVERRLPTPEELPGAKYADSPHARHKMALKDLDRNNCREAWRRPKDAPFDTPRPLEWFVKRFGGSLLDPPPQWRDAECVQMFDVHMDHATQQLQGLMISKPTGDDEFFSVTGVRAQSRVTALDLQVGDRIVQVQTSQGTFSGPDMRQAVADQVKDSGCQTGWCGLTLSVERPC